MIRPFKGRFMQRYTALMASTPAKPQIKKPPEGDFGISWWPGAESNHRHKDFQSSALPTELPGQELEL